MSETRQWSGRTDGAGWMHMALIGMLKVLPLGLLYFLMAFVIPFYLLFNSKGYLAIYHYLRQRQGWSMVKSFLGCYGNHFLFGTAVLDRFAAFAGKRFKADVQQPELLAQANTSEAGFIQLSSHIGNQEMSGYMLHSNKPMNVIAFPGEKETVRRRRAQLLERNNIRLVLADDDMGWLFTLNEALASGEVVSIHADRIFGSPKYLEVSLLGGKVRLPQGPFALATMRNLPVLASFPIKSGIKHYKVFLFRLDTPQMRALPRQERMMALAGAYVTAIEAILKNWPLQWYNFYEFWES